MNKEPIVFEIEVNPKATSLEREDPEIKKRLEQNQQKSITKEQIQEKLKKAEERRLLKQVTHDNEERRSRANERKNSLE